MESRTKIGIATEEYYRKLLKLHQEDVHLEYNQVEEILKPLGLNKGILQAMKAHEIMKPKHIKGQGKSDYAITDLHRAHVGARLMKEVSRVNSGRYDWNTIARRANIVYMKDKEFFEDPIGQKIIANLDKFITQL